MARQYIWLYKQDTLHVAKELEKAENKKNRQKEREIEENVWRRQKHMTKKPRQHIHVITYTSVKHNYQ